MDPSYFIREYHASFLSPPNIDPQGHTSGVSSVAFHASLDLAHIMATGSEDMSVRLWDWGEGKELMKLEVGTRPYRPYL